MTLTLGPLTIPMPVIQAALSGYSDYPMRAVARRCGARFTFAQVMLDQFLVTLKDRRRTRHFLYIGPEEHPVGGQLMGCEPEQFVLGARRLVEAGFDLIDINFGCPVRKVLGRGRGGFHLGDPAAALQIVERTRQAVPPEIPVTVKLRRGIDETPESRERFFEILDGLFERGAAAVTVHGRTVCQAYRGRSDWEFLRQVKEHLGEKVMLGSGDLFSAEDCLAMMRQTGVEGVTAARGAIGNPWIFRDATALLAGEPLPPAPSLHEQAEIIDLHFQLAEQMYGRRGGKLMRKFGARYAALHPDYDRLRDAFVKIRSVDDWREIRRQWYRDDLPGRRPGPEMHHVE